MFVEDVVEVRQKYWSEVGAAACEYLLVMAVWFHTKTDGKEVGAPFFDDWWWIRISVDSPLLAE